MNFVHQRAAGPDSRTPGQRMGWTIRQFRHRRELTLVQLARLTDLSHSFLSQIERGLAQPSMKSLHRIAEALGTSQDRLIADGNTGTERTSIALLRRDEGVPIPMSEGGSTGSARQLLAGPGEFYPTEFVGLGRELGEYFSHDGNEFVYIVEGLIEVELDHTSYLLESGDSMRYPGRMPHRWRAASAAPTRILMIHTGPDAHSPERTP